MSHHVFSLPDIASERAFRVQYGRPGMLLELLAVLMRLLTFPALLLRACFRAAGHSCAAAAASLYDAPGWLSFALQGSMLLVYAVLDQDRYILFRGPMSIFHRTVYLLGVVLLSHPVNSKRHQLFRQSIICVICRTPAAAYWVGSAVGWLAQMLIDMADPQHICGNSTSCVVTALLHLLYNPAALLQQLQQRSTAAAGLRYMLELVIPGLLLTSLECKARQRWWLDWQQQQQRARAGAAAANAPVALAEDHVSGDSTGELLAPQTSKEQQLEQKQSSCSSSRYASTDHSSSAAAQHAAQHALPQIPAAAASSDRSADSRSSSNIPPAGSSDPLEPPSEAAVVPGNEPSATAAAAEVDPSLVAIKQLAAAVAASIHQAHSGVSNSSEFTDSTALPQTRYLDLVPTMMVFGDSSMAARQPCMDSLILSSTAAAAGGVAADRSVLYMSPCRHQVMSFKFNSPLDTSPELFAQFKSELTALVHQHHEASGDPRPLVTNFSAFPGCINIVISIALLSPPAAAAGDVQQRSSLAGSSCPVTRLDQHYQQQQQQQQQQMLQQKLQSWLQRWPGYSLLALQVHTLPPAAAAAAEDSSCAAAAAAVSLQPLVVSYHAADAVPLLADSGSSSSSSILICQPSKAGDVNAKVSTRHAMIEQLHHQGYKHLRVVAVAQDSGDVVVDRSWQIQQLLSTPDLSTDADHPLADLHWTLDLRQIKPSSESESLQQQHHVLSVVVLAERQQATLDSTSSSSSSQQLSSDTASQQHAVSLVLAQIPMLLLPAAAAAELQDLQSAAFQTCGSPDAARLEMQALTRDLAAVLHAARSSGAAAAQQQQYRAIVAALTRVFRARRMTACLRVLQDSLEGLKQQLEVQCGTAAIGMQARSSPVQEAGFRVGVTTAGSTGSGDNASVSRISSSGGSSGGTEGDVDHSKLDQGSPSWLFRAVSYISHKLHPKAGRRCVNATLSAAAAAAELLYDKTNTLLTVWKTFLLFLHGSAYQTPGIEAVRVVFKTSAQHKWDGSVVLWYVSVLAVSLVSMHCLVCSTDEEMPSF